MPSPFPGMNPYLEHPDFWSDFHNRLIVALANVLTPQVLPKYRVTTDKRIYEIRGSNALLVGRPDVLLQRSRNGRVSSNSDRAITELPVQPVKVLTPTAEEVRESYLEVKDAATQEVVTVVEILSPTNKQYDGRQKYEQKRQKVLESRTNLVEIDLLRLGEPLPLSGDDNRESQYRILVSRASVRPLADLYPFNLSDRIPLFPLPLRPEDVEPVIDLQALLNEVYDQSGCDYFIDYNSNPDPPLSECDRAAIEIVLREKRLR
ncbi:MAG: DUF4058 family protein [Cyanobacteriota bacterium]|nr:DUF4058 family protein [Cyanobacteriota bacterium]